MKSLLIAFTLLASVFTASATDGKVSRPVEKAFQQNFAKAENLRWTESAEMVKASFEKDQQNYAAFFNHQGELVAVAHFISMAQLSEALQSDLKSKTNGTNIIELFELTENGDTKFYATLDNGKKQQVLVAVKNKWHRF